jgi:hypothetical protein
MSLDGRTNDVKKRSKKEQPGLSWPAFAAEWRSWWTAKAPVLFFGAKFGALVALLYILLAIPSVEQALFSYLKAYAWASSAILDLFGQGTHVTDVTIASSSSFAIAIRRGCDAVEPTWLLCAAIIAFRAAGPQPRPHRQPVPHRPPLPGHFSLGPPRNLAHGFYSRGHRPLLPLGQLERRGA